MKLHVTMNQRHLFLETAASLLLASIVMATEHSLGVLTPVHATLIQVQTQRTARVIMDAWDAYIQQLKTTMRLHQEMMGHVSSLDVLMKTMPTTTLSQILPVIVATPQPLPILMEMGQYRFLILRHSYKLSAKSALSGVVWNGSLRVVRLTPMMMLIFWRGC